MVASPSMSELFARRTPEAGDVVGMNLHQLVERPRRGLLAARDRALRERLEVENTGIAPPSRLLFLDPEERLDVAVPPRVDVRLDRGPRCPHAPHERHPPTVPV